MTEPQDLRTEIEAALKECDAWIGYNVNGIKDTVAHIQIFHTRDALRAALTRLDHLETTVSQMGRERLGWFEQVEQQRHRAEAALARLGHLQKRLDEPWYFPEKRIMELEDRLGHLEHGVIYAKRLLLQCDPDAALEELQSLTASSSAAGGE